MKTILFIFLYSSQIFTLSSLDFYKVFSSANEKQIDDQILSLKNTKNAQQKVYLGALLMKKSDFQKDLKTKIATFKQGAEILEKEIALDKNNIEYRFIRFIIQENAPKVLKYNINLEEDKKIILQNFKKSSSFLQKEIEKYAKISNSLKL